MRRHARAFLLTAALLAALPATAGAATLTVSGTTITFDAAPGEANTAVIVKQGPLYFVGDQNPAVPLNTADPGTALLCPTTPAGLGLPAGRLCAVAATSLVENLGDGDDTGVIGDTTGGPVGTINGGPANDLLVGGQENDIFHGDAGDDNVAYAGVDAASIIRTAGVTASLPAFPSGAATTGNGQTGESDTINNDIEGLIGGNGDDTLTGNDGPNTILGAAPAGIGGVTSSPAGIDTIDGKGGDDTLVGGDGGTVTGGLGADNLIGGRNPAATTVVHGNDGNDTVISGLGSDDIFGDAGSNTLAYASVVQGGLTIVDRGTNGVTAGLPNAGQTVTGGRTGGAEHDTIHDGFGTLVGSNGDDVLTGSDGADTIVGVAPAGTAGVAPGPAGNDTLKGGAGVDILLGAEGKDTLDGGPDADVFLAGAGDDTLLTRDEVVESPTCGDGIDSVKADPTDTPAADCENVDTKLHETVKPKLTLKPALLRVGKGLGASITLRCANEPDGCHGTLLIQTRQKLPSGKAKRQYRLANVKFRIPGPKAKKFHFKLSAKTLKLVGPHHSLKLTGTAAVRDSSGNLRTKSYKLRLKRR